MSKELRSFSHEVNSSSEEVSAGAPAGWIDIGLKEHVSPEQNGDLMGVDLVFFGFSSLDSFHINAMT